MSPTITIDSIVKTSADQVSADLDGEAVILGLEKSEYYGLREVGASIWRLIQEPRRVVDIRDAILAEYDVEPEPCERDLIGLLAQLASEGLLEVEE
jgi:hypothetical protein